jgi:hypothetical protein
MNFTIQNLVPHIGHLETMEHKNIVQTYEKFKNDTEYVFIVEFCPCKYFTLH